MSDLDTSLTRLIALREEGRHADARLLRQQLFAEAGPAIAPPRSSFFMTMLEWKLLADEYAPAHAALKA